MFGAYVRGWCHAAMSGIVATGAIVAAIVSFGLPEALVLELGLPTLMGISAALAAKSYWAARANRNYYVRLTASNDPRELLLTGDSSGRVVKGPSNKQRRPARPFVSYVAGWIQAIVAKEIIHVAGQSADASGVLVAALLFGCIPLAAYQAGPLVCAAASAIGSVRHRGIKEPNFSNQMVAIRI